MINPFKKHTYEVLVKLSFDGVDQYKTVTTEARHGFIAQRQVEEAAYDELRDLARDKPEAGHTGLVAVLAVERVDQVEAAQVAA